MHSDVETPDTCNRTACWFHWSDCCGFCGQAQVADVCFAVSILEEALSERVEEATSV